VYMKKFFVIGLFLSYQKSMISHQGSAVNSQRGSGFVI